MTYEFMMGMGSAEEAIRLVSEAQEADGRDDFLGAASLLQQGIAESEAQEADRRDDFLRAASMLQQVIAEDPSRANELRQRQIQMYAEGGDCFRARQLLNQILPTAPSGDPNMARYQQYVDQCRPGGLRPSPFDEPGTPIPGTPIPGTLTPAAPGEPAPATEKETWWTGDVGEMFESFFLKLGIGEQAGQEAQYVAREAAGETAGPTSISEVAPSVQQAPTVQVEDTDAPPWYEGYAPHMVIGGLGVGAVVILLLVLRKKD